MSTCSELDEARDNSPCVLKDGILLKYVASAEGIGGRSSISPMTFQGLLHVRRSGMMSALEEDARSLGTRPDSVQGRCRDGDVDARSRVMCRLPP
jgi:hypothetical protein